MREEYETTLEELRAANEELQSTNEEYQSTLEELQPINEELQTINQELKTKVEEVSQAHGDLQNLLGDGRIRWLYAKGGVIQNEGDGESHLRGAFINIPQHKSTQNIVAQPDRRLGRTRWRTFRHHRGRSLHE